MPGLLAARVNELVKLKEKVEGREALVVDTPPVNPNVVKWYFTEIAGAPPFVVADDTAAVDTANAATVAPTRMAMARYVDPSFLIAALPTGPSPALRRPVPKSRDG
jgi:hypothetical protein